MHFTILYIMEDEKIENLSYGSVEEEFSNQFCYCCGETEPPYPICDWFQIGGRWNDILWATKGIKGEPSWGDTHETGPKQFSIVEIRNLIKDININNIHGVASRNKGECWEEGWGTGEKSSIVADYIEKINKKEIKGCVALIDCHD